MVDQPFMTCVSDRHARALKRVGVSLAFIPERVEFSGVDVGWRKGTKISRAKWRQA